MRNTRITTGSVLVCIALLAPLASLSQDLEKAELALQMIGRFANDICNKPDLKGKSSSVQAKGLAKVEVGKLVKRLADLKIEGATQFDSAEYEGLLQKDLLPALQESTKCKEKVFNDLKGRFLPASTGSNTGKTPADRARTELQQLGVAWNSESFIRSLVDGDTRSIELFLKGGMSPTLNYKGASAAVYALQPKANNRVAVLDLLLKHGLDPNASLQDGRVMVGTHDMLPPHFEHRLTPSGYEAWKRSFAGPADLWLVIVGSYAGPEPDDFAQLRALGSRGAKFAVSLAYLREYEPVLRDTPVYWDVRNEVERLAKLQITQRPGSR